MHDSVRPCRYNGAQCDVYCLFDFSIQPMSFESCKEDEWMDRWVEKLRERESKIETEIKIETEREREIECEREKEINREIERERKS